MDHMLVPYGVAKSDNERRRGRVHIAEQLVQGPLPAQRRVADRRLTLALLDPTQRWSGLALAVATVSLLLWLFRLPFLRFFPFFFLDIKLNFEKAWKPGDPRGCGQRSVGVPRSRFCVRQQSLFFRPTSPFIALLLILLFRVRCITAVAFNVREGGRNKN